MLGWSYFMSVRGAPGGISVNDTFKFEKHLWRALFFQQNAAVKNAPESVVWKMKVNSKFSNILMADHAFPLEAQFLLGEMFNLKIPKQNIFSTEKARYSWRQ